MALTIGTRTLAEIHAHAEASYPEECCGLLIAESGSKEVVGLVKMRNAFSGPKHDRYHIDPLELFRADREAARTGMVIAGIYHSHPDYPANLSKFDLEHAFPWYSYVVVSVPKGQAGDTRSWLPNQDRDAATEEEIVTYEGGREAQGAIRRA